MRDTGLHIFLVDVPSALQRHLRTVLGALGFRLHWPEAGQVIECLESRPATALLLPLPGVRGVSIPGAIQLAGEAHARGVPVLLLAAGEEEALQVMRALPVGAADLLLEPFEPLVLRARMAGMVERFQARVAQEALRESEERYRLITLATSDAIYDWDMSAHVLRWNLHVQTLFSYAPEQVQQDFQWWVHRLHPEDRRRVMESLREAIARGDVRWREEYRFQRADGSYADVVDLGYVERDADGKPVRMVGSLQDVTKRKRAERNLRFLSEASASLGCNLELRETLQRLAWLVVPRLAEGCTVDVVEEDGSLHRMALAHPEPDKRARAEALWRKMDRAVIGRSCLARVVASGQPEWGSSSPPPPRHKAERQDAVVLALLEPLGISSYLLLPLSVRGRVVGVLGLGWAEPTRRPDELDMTLVQELASRAAFAVENALLYQKAQQAISLRDEFLSIAAHELRTPTTSLKLNVQTLLRRLSREGTVPREQILNRLEGLDQGVARLAALENQLLDVARISSGRLSLRPEPVDLVRVVREVMARFAPRADSAGCEWVLTEQGPVVGQWDRMRLEQVVTNLISNALKYGAGKPVRIRVLDGEGHAELSVSDRGIGIAPEHLSRIFGRFERAVSDRHYGGLGLGLYITRQIVEAMHGEVNVSSRPGHGSTFTVVLPCSVEQVVRPAAHEEDASWGGSAHPH